MALNAEIIAAEHEAHAENDVFDENAKQEAIDTFMNNGEINGERLNIAGQLNDRAQIEIWGTNGKTEGFVDPATGRPLEKPIQGKLNEIRENPRYGTKAADREAAAEKYEADLEALLTKTPRGKRPLELAQAKLIMDLREKDVDARATYTAKLISQKIPAAQAKSQAVKVYKAKDKKRIETIREEGVMHVVQYVQHLDNRNTSDRERLAPAVNPADNPTEPMPAVVVDPRANRGVRNRVRNAMARAHVRAAGYYGNTEKGRRRKLGTAAAIIGAGALAYLELKGGGASQHVADRPKTGVNPLDVQSPADLPKPPQAGLNPGGPSAAPSLIDHVPGTHPGSESHKALETFTVQDGQNPWTISEHQLKLHGFHHPSPAQIEAYDKQMAGLNPDVYSYSGDSSEHIDVGTKLKLPKFRFR
jgi:hypothetical protein